MTATPRFRQDLVIGASAMTVWNALVDPAVVKDYYLVPLTTVSLRTDGQIVYGEGDPPPIRGKVLEAQAPFRFVHTFLFSHRPEDPASRVAYQLRPLAPDACHLSLVHDGFTEETGTFADISGGWPQILDGLKKLLDGGKDLSLEDFPAPNPFQHLEEWLQKPHATGVFVVQVGSQSEGARLGLQPGDIVTHVDDTPSPDPESLARLLTAPRAEGVPAEDTVLGADHVLRIHSPNGKSHTHLVPAKRLGVRGCKVEKDTPAWIDSPTSDYEPDLSPFATERTLWLRFKFGDEPAGYERVHLKPEGDTVTFDHLVFFGGSIPTEPASEDASAADAEIPSEEQPATIETPGEDDAPPPQEPATWAYRCHVVSTHTLDKTLSTTALEYREGVEPDECVHAIVTLDMPDGQWVGSMTRPDGTTRELDTHALCLRACNVYALPLLALTMPLEEGAVLNICGAEDNTGATVQRFRLENTGKKTIQVDGTDTDAWAIVWRHYGEPEVSEHFYIDDNRELVRIDWGPGYGGAWCEQADEATIKAELPPHIPIE